jgi:hypothetical protein
MVASALLKKTRFRLLLLCSALLLVMAGIVSAQGGGTIGYGSTVFGRVTPEMPQVLYSFSGAVGDLITARVTTYSGGSDPRLTLVNASGQAIVVNDTPAFRDGSTVATLSAFLPSSGTYGLLVDSANGQPGDFMLELRGRTPVQSTVLESGIPVRVDVPANTAELQYFTFEADPYCATTLTVYDVSIGLPATFPFVVTVRDEDGIPVAMLQGGRVLENRLTVAPDGDPNPGTEQYEVAVGSADGVTQGSLMLVITCADDAPACPPPADANTATGVPTLNPNGTPTLVWTPPPSEPCIDPFASPTPSVILEPMNPSVDIADLLEPTEEATPDPEHSADVPIEVTGEVPAGVNFPEPNKNLTEEPPLEPILPDPPSIALNPTATPVMPMTPCPTPPPPGDDPCVDGQTPILTVPNVDTTVDLVTPQSQPLTYAVAPTATPTPGVQGTPCPTATPMIPTVTPTRPPTVQQDCSGFAMTSPTDGLPNGGVTVYWDPVPWATSYRVNVYGEGGGLLLSVEVGAPASNVGIDVSAGNIGPGFVFTVQVQALQAGVVRCSDGRTLFRESNGGDDPDEPRDEPDDPTATFCPPTIACN